MSNYNCGAATLAGLRFPTKKALKVAMASAPEEVYFDGTSLFHTVNGEPPGYRGNELPEDVHLAVVGPDPFTNRRWYATVALRAGKVVVS